MDNAEWIIIDTETNGFTDLIFVVELAAQKMIGWAPCGEPFRRLLNQNAYIPPDASRVHGYTRQILERDGEPPLSVYRDFANYAGKLPLVSYNLEYDLDNVLMPEWRRLGIKTIGERGFCAYRLAQRLLDPIPAGNCKLQTLRQYYRLPERGAHTAQGDVQTVIDLLGNILRPLTKGRNLASLSDIRKFTEDEWFPSLIPFGKFKGRNFREARDSQDLFNWLKWLSESSNSRSKAMGIWYLNELEKNDRELDTIFSSMISEQIEDGVYKDKANSVIVYMNPEVSILKDLIAASRGRLAEYEAKFMNDRSSIEAMRAELFANLRADYQLRDQLKLIVEYRRKYLTHLIDAGEEIANGLVDEYLVAKEKCDNDFEEVNRTISGRKELSLDDQNELKDLWKKLVSIYHPDRFKELAPQIRTVG